MSAPTIPVKTALGQEALRRRTGEIGPRHRTLLFLVDGRRPLAEVLGLAHQAGSATSHFEDLVRMGYVELPSAAAAVEPAALEEAPLEAPQPAEITALAVEVSEPAEPVTLPPAAPAPVPAPPPEPARIEDLPRRPFLPPGREAAAPPPPEPVPAAPPAEEPPALERARAQLLDCLRCDPQPNGVRLAERVRSALGSSTLIDVVWTMERGLHHHQRTHHGLLALQRARELLGLGNTLVDEDSRPGRLDDDW